MASRTSGSSSSAARKAALERLGAKLAGGRVFTLGELFQGEGVPLERATVVALSRKASVLARNVGTLGDEDLGALHVCSREAAAEALKRDDVLLAILQRKAAMGFTAAQLSDTVSPRDKRAFLAALKDRRKERRWPAGVGAIEGLNNFLVFLMEHLTGQPAAARPSTNGHGHAPDFASAFGEAFDKLRRERRVNLVTLASLRQALPEVPRETFDRELYALRRANQFVLESYDGRHGKPKPEELEGGIEEGGRRFVYASRRDHD